jgi:hypothetical protein
MGDAETEDPIIGQGREGALREQSEVVGQTVHPPFGLRGLAP